MRLICRGAAALAGLLLAAPSFAHHGKDFLLTATDDMPLRGHLYPLLSVDDTFDRDSGRRVVEITPGILFAVTDRLSLEPHGHWDREAGGSRYRYIATAVEARYRAGYVGHSEWRWGGSLEYEHPRGEDPNNLQGRLLLVRNFTRSLVAINLVANRTLQAGGRTPLSIIAGLLRPLSPSNGVGVEFSVPFPFADGVEILPGLYHQFGGTEGHTSLKLGVGVFVSRNTTAGTLHSALIHRF